MSTAGEDEALYLRMRLIRLHGMNRMIFPKRQWMKMEKCILDKTVPENVLEIGRRILPATFTEEAARDAEFALVDFEEPVVEEVTVRELRSLMGDFKPLCRYSARDLREAEQAAVRVLPR